MSIPEEIPANKQRDPITRFKDDYFVALADAHVSAEHTATEGWKRLFNQHRDENRKARADVSSRLHELADTLEGYGLSTEDEKEIGNLKNSVVALRESDEVFEKQTIQPVRDPVEMCDRVINEAMVSARREENLAPLHNSGLEELMRMAVASVARPRWDNEVGVVVVAEPTTTD
jgi:hypothetical protein